MAVVGSAAVDGSAVEAAAGPVVAAMVAAVSRAAAATSAAAAQEGAGNMKHHEFLKRLQDERIAAAIRTAEAKTSGEIRVFISRKETSDPVAAAKNQFTRMGMTKT